MEPIAVVGLTIVAVLLGAAVASRVRAGSSDLAPMSPNIAPPTRAVPLRPNGGPSATTPLETLLAAQSREVVASRAGPTVPRPLIAAGLLVVAVAAVVLGYGLIAAEIAIGVLAAAAIIVVAREFLSSFDETYWSSLGCRIARRGRPGRDLRSLVALIVAVPVVPALGLIWLVASSRTPTIEDILLHGLPEPAEPR